ncbi:uncharacterized protein TNCV_129341 [Trichonephila clavipes]|nr:uncharacterized protein TNCV_129341 [Trichonephila clavipes]
MWVYPAGSIRGTWNHPECHLQALEDDGNVSRCYSTGLPRVTTPNEDRYLAITAKRQTEHSIRPVSSAPSYRYEKADRVQTFRAEYSSPFIVSPIPVFTRHHRERLLRWAGVKGTQTGAVQTDTTVQSSGHGKTRYRSSSLLCRVSSDFSRYPVSSACKTMYWSSAAVIPRGTETLNY